MPDGSRAAIDALLSRLPDDMETFRARCSAVADWDAIVSRARDEGVLAVLMHGVRQANVSVSAGAFAAAERHCAVEQMWTSQVSAALDEALRQLDACGVKAAGLKGPVLAERFYPHSELRPCIDGDLLVDETQLENAVQALTALGYRHEKGPAADYARRHKHHVNLRRPGMPDLELHFRVYAGFGTVIEAEGVLARSSEARTAAGARVWVLAPEDEFLYLAVHAAGHSYVRLLWLYDIKLLLGKHSSLDWGVVAERAKDLRLLTVLSFTAAVLRDCLGVPVPRLNTIEGRRWRLARRLLPTVMRPTDRSARENFESLVFKALLCDRPITGVRLVGHHVARSMKRRAHRLAPTIVPHDWAG